MSIKYLNLAWETVVDSPGEKLVLLKLADNANDDGSCWPSLATICRQTGLSKQAVINCIKKFEASDPPLLRVIRRRGEGGANLPNQYQLLLGPSARQISREVVKPVDQQSSQLTRVVKPVDQGSQVDGLGVVKPVDPNHHLEPPIEPSREGDPILERKRAFREYTALEEKILKTAGTEQAKRLREIQNIAGRRGEAWWGWLREHVAPHMDRLGAEFPAGVAAAVKAFHGSSDPKRWGLKDFVEALKAYKADSPEHADINGSKWARFLEPRGGADGEDRKAG